MHITRKLHIKILLTYLKPQIGRVVLLTILLFGSICLELISPQILRYYIQETKAQSDLQTFTNAAILFLITVLATMGLALWATYVTEIVSWTATNMLRTDLALHCLQLDMSFHNQHSAGELVERVDGDIKWLSNFFSQFVIQIIGNIILLIGILLFLSIEDWRLGGTFTIFTLVAMIILGRIRTIASPYWQSVLKISAEFIGFLNERIVGHEDIYKNNGVSYIMRQFYTIAKSKMVEEKKANLYGSITLVTTIILFTISYDLAFILGSILNRIGAVEISGLYVVFFYIGMLNKPIERIIGQIEDLQKVNAIIIRIDELLNASSEDRSGSILDLPTGALSVEFQDVSFGYQSNNLVLHNLSFRLEAGKVLGVIGRTGSGKTTIMRLLLRLYKPKKGRIYINGVDIQTIQPAFLRSRLGVVTQDIQLFHATVRDNLTLFNQQITDDCIIQSLRELELWPWYCRLQNGLDTVISSDGSNLSAGEAQLLAFARVFLQNPDVVILDEASSRLDRVTEELIKNATERLLYQRTAIIIAHRLSTLYRADLILLLENGSLCEFGERELLLKDSDSRYRNLIHMYQSGDII